MQSTTRAMHSFDEYFSLYSAKKETVNRFFPICRGLSRFLCLNLDRYWSFLLQSHLPNNLLENNSG